MRRWLVTTVVLILIAVGVDRLALWGAETYLAGRVKAAAHLSADPDVSISGFPFLTQVAAGRYDDVTITITDFRGHGLAIERIRAKGHGVHLPASALVHRSARIVPIDRVVASVVLSYADLNGVLPGVRASYAGHGEVRLTGSIGGVSESVDVRPAVSSSALSLAATGALAALSHRFDLSGLPFGLHLVRVSASAAGVTIAAQARHVLLPIR